MTFVVPFDGSELAETALVRASEFADVLDERVLAVTVVPRRNKQYAREHGWLGPEEPFDVKSIISSLHERVVDLVPEADFRHITVDKYAPTGTISTQISKAARQEDASMVFLGSENAGRIVTSVTSVGGNISSRGGYDIVIIRNRAPSKIERLQDAGDPDAKSDFFVT
ncbi:universal stress protein [Natronomonas marina]|jgi:nucleotide-binding universal stress UspA family protein|uniref:universal stress protein n=1 Tax=Natronomonas marina TaxID=2961939 RepID=UPI0020C959E9|nr:universal stress protein [Natronomonas marina]